MIFYILYKLGYFFANTLSLRGAYWLADRVTDLQYMIAKKDREAVAKNLSILLNKDISECRVLARKVFRNFGLYLVDFFRMHRIDKAWLNDAVKVDGVDNLKGVLRDKRGTVLISCHIGNWEMGAAVIALMGYDISAVALTHKHKAINEFFIRQRESKGAKVISVNSVMKRCVSALLNKGLLALVGDRDFTNRGIVMDFFGVPTSIPRGPATLSIKTDSPILPVFFLRENRFSYRLIFDKPIEPKELKSYEKEETIRVMTQKFVTVMEKYIKMYPEQWLIFRNFWESPASAVVV